ncbi:uncharacterized protein LOC129230688 [Uloborus diversus]|uniref:uncharacterized protein LOC129230688 n=1 Tax=Uloborus diversus TaxID=327109 RepID=UPI002409A560|nr:uncharacterized protein LOC129230688 [Uloborus diversus]
MDDMSTTNDSEYFSQPIPESTIKYVKDLEEQLFLARDKLTEAEEVLLYMKQMFTSIDYTAAEIRRVCYRQEQRNMQLVGAQPLAFNAASNSQAASNINFPDKKLGTPKKGPARDLRDTEVPSAIECFEKLPLTVPLSPLKLKLFLDDRRQGQSLQKGAQFLTQDMDGLMRQLNCLKDMLLEKKASMHLIRVEDFDGARLLARLEKIVSSLQH